MEHGHVVVHYATDLPREQVADLERLARRHGGDMILAPSRHLEGRYHHGRTTDHDC